MSTTSDTSAERIKRMTEIGEQANAQKLAAYAQSLNPKTQIPFTHLTSMCQTLLKVASTDTAHSDGTKYPPDWAQALKLAEAAQVIVPELAHLSRPKLTHRLFHDLRRLKALAKMDL